MRFATGGESWDRFVPVFALPYAIWTLYVHLIVAAHASFRALLHWLPLVLLVAVAATVGWFRLRDPAGRVDAFPEPPGLAGGNLASGAAPLVFLSLTMCWVGLLCAALHYPVFWWDGGMALWGAGIRK